MNEEKSALIKELTATFHLFAKMEWRKQSVEGMKSSEVRVLGCLKMLAAEGYDGVNISDISKKLYVTSPTITQMVNSLMNEGYVERYNDCRDKRITLIRLTSKGEDAAQKALDQYRCYYSGLIDKLGMEQSKTLIALLNQVYEYTFEVRPSTTVE